MSYFDVDQELPAPKPQKKSHAYTLGGILLICGFALVTWHVADAIFILQEIKIAPYSDIILLSRLVVGVLFILAGVMTKKNEDWSIIKP